MDLFLSVSLNSQHQTIFFYQNYSIKIIALRWLKTQYL